MPEIRKPINRALDVSMMAVFVNDAGIKPGSIYASQAVLRWRGDEQISDVKFK